MENSAILSQILEEAEIDPSAISIFAGIMIVYFAILGVVALALYLLEAFALFNMAKSAGYSRPWRGFIPFAVFSALTPACDRCSYPPPPRPRKTTRPGQARQL